MAEINIPEFIDPQVLKDSHDKKTTQDVKRHLSGRDIVQAKIERSDLEVQLAFRNEAAALFKSRIMSGEFDPESLHELVDMLNTENFGNPEIPAKEMDKTVTELKQKIKDGFYIEKEVTCYGLIDEANSQTHWYDSNGNYLNSERYKRAQSTIFTNINNKSKENEQEQPFGGTGSDNAVNE